MSHFLFVFRKGVLLHWWNGRHHNMAQSLDFKAAERRVSKVTPLTIPPVLNLSKHEQTYLMWLSRDAYLSFLLAHRTMGEAAERRECKQWMKRGGNRKSEGARPYVGKWQWLAGQVRRKQWWFFFFFFWEKSTCQTPIVNPQPTQTRTRAHTQTCCFSLSCCQDTAASLSSMDRICEAKRARAH